MDYEKQCAIALSYLSGVGPIRAKKMLVRAGSFAEAVRLDAAELVELKVPAKAIEQLVSGWAMQQAEREVAFAKTNGVRVYDCLDEAYPKRLADLPDSPLVLYVRGDRDLNALRTVGIVGTRKPSPHGRHFCEQLVEQLSDYGVTVISGMAYGVDIAAHEACLRTKTPTFAVMAHGLNEVYPSAHRASAAEVMKRGALVSEYPSGLRSRKEFFPQRNRIIAALSDAVVVVESARRGGSMITATLANGYARPVFAVPGRVADKASQGCNELIKTNRANLLESAHDIAYLLGWHGRKRSVAEAKTGSLFEDVPPDERRVLNLLDGADALDVDTLLLRSELPSGQLAGVLLSLELKGSVRALPGKRYAIT